MSKKIYHIRIDDYELGEAEAMYSEEGALLDFWALNDAYWRSEYLNGFIEKLGYHIEECRDEKLINKFKEELRKYI